MNILLLAGRNDKAIPMFPLAALIPFVLALLQSCSLLKNTKTETEKNQQSAKSSDQRKLDASRKATTDQRVFEWKLDRSGNQSILQIWPKGQFSFSADKGFEGEAEKIQLISKSQKSGSVLKLKDSLANTTEQINKESALKAINQQQNTKTVKTETPAFWLIIGLVLMVLAGVLFYNHLKP